MARRASALDRTNALPAETVTALASLLREGQPTVFALSSDLRHALRAEMCLKGWPWPAADEASRAGVNAALNRIGARWPRWEEGQPEWTQVGVLNGPRTDCLRCGRSLQGDQFRFCSQICAKGWFQSLGERDRQNWHSIETSAIFRARAVARIPERACLTCGDRFVPRAIGTKAGRFCSDACRR